MYTYHILIRCLGQEGLGRFPHCPTLNVSHCKSSGHIRRNVGGNLYISSGPWNPVLIFYVLCPHIDFLQLKMIDSGGFFITLNLISARKHWPHDCSLLAIGKFTSHFILLLKAVQWELLRNIQRADPFFKEQVGKHDSPQLRDGQEVMEVGEKL